MQTWYWDNMKTVWTGDVQAIVDYCMANYLSAYGQDTLKKTPEEIQANEGLAVAFGMAMWGYGTVGEDGSLTTPSGKVFDLVSSFPTIEDYYNETYAAYSGDPEAYWGVEAADGTDVFNTANTEFIRHWGPLDPAGEGGIPNIAGITKVDDYTVQVKTNGYEAPAIYQIFGAYVAPLHYYGDPAQYDYANNKFGHPFGDLSIVEAKTTEPMGAGPYKFIKYENKVIYYEANENYWKGAPKTNNVQFMETITAEVAAGLVAGTVDCGEMNGSRAYFDEVRGYNSNGELSGDVVVTSRVDNLGYGYMGFNADKVNVGGEPGSDASKNLRKALATVFAVYRDTAINSYYGDAASVINYPISNTSWAAPQATDPDYAIAFSVDVNGNPIYTSDMTPEQKYEAALQASLGFFEAAGFKVVDGKVVAGPQG
jgi:peptide/nickel transport system substrate-binding protein